MKILVANLGSTSFKYRLFDMADERLLAAVQSGIDDANKAVSQAEAIKRFRILDVDFTEPGGELTPTLKLKRNVVLKHYAADVEALYA